MKESTGTVIAASKQWWLKVNTKAFRIGPLDGAIFPYIVKVTYTEDGKTIIIVKNNSITPFSVPDEYSSFGLFDHLVKSWFVFVGRTVWNCENHIRRHHVMQHGYQSLLVGLTLKEKLKLFVINANRPMNHPLRDMALTDFISVFPTVFTAYL